MEKASTNADLDVEFMERTQAKAEVVKLRNAIRRHRDCQGHDLCWYHPELWGLLPEEKEISPQVPPFPEFICNCARYRWSLGRGRWWLWVWVAIVVAIFCCGIWIGRML